MKLFEFKNNGLLSYWGMFYRCYNLNTELTIIGNPNNYGQMFNNAATNSTAKIIVNYTSESSSSVDDMISTKSTNSNVIKGSNVN